MSHVKNRLGRSVKLPSIAELSALVRFVKKSIADDYRAFEVARDVQNQLSDLICQ